MLSVCSSNKPAIVEAGKYIPCTSFLFFFLIKADWISESVHSALTRTEAASTGNETQLVF